MQKDKINLKNELNESARPTLFFQQVKQDEPTIKSRFKTSTQPTKLKG